LTSPSASPPAICGSEGINRSSASQAAISSLARSNARLNEVSWRSARLTVNNLMSGQHIECKDLDELLGAEAAIVEACQNLKAYLETALTFDGREELHEF
jgi:hypothetical protein